MTTYVHRIISVRTPTPLDVALFKSLEGNQYLAYPVCEGEVGLLGLQPFLSHPAREDLHRHCTNHVVTPVGVGCRAHPLRGKHGRNLPRSPKFKKKRGLQVPLRMVKAFEPTLRGVRSRGSVAG